MLTPISPNGPKHVTQSKHVRKTSETRQKDDRNTPERRQKHARKTTETCQKDDRNTPERRQKHVRKTTETCQKDDRNTSERRQKHVRKTTDTSERRQKHVRKTTETRQKDDRNTKHRQTDVWNTRASSTVSSIKLPRQAAASSWRVKLPRHPLTRHHQLTSTRCFEMHPDRDLHVVMVTRPAVRVPQSVLCASRRGCNGSHDLHTPDHMTHIPRVMRLTHPRSHDLHTPSHETYTPRIT